MKKLPEGNTMRKSCICMCLAVVLLFPSCAVADQYPVISDYKTAYTTDIVRTLEEYDGVVLSDLQISETKIAFVLKNESEITYCSGIYFPLEYEIDGEWYQVEVRPDIEFPAIEYVVLPGAKHDVWCNLDTYGATAWKDGHYRILISFKPEELEVAPSEIPWLEIPFAVSDGIPTMS